MTVVMVIQSSWPFYTVILALDHENELVTVSLRFQN